MANWMNKKCPKCSDADCIDVAARVWVRLTDDGSDADESQDCGHDYDETNSAKCVRCGFGGTLGDFPAIEEAQR